MGPAFKTDVHRTTVNSTKKGLAMEGWWNAYILSTAWGVMGHPGKAEYAPTEVGLEGKVGKWKT